LAQLFATPAGSDALALAQLGRDNRLVVCAGAGLSRAAPSDLPDGRALARDLHQRLRVLFPGLLDSVAQDDLLAVADALASEAGGLSLLQRLACDAAGFTSAVPNEGHELLALLILEGAVVALLTNWDDCIERAARTERLQVVVTDEDRLLVHGARVFKIHGCATKPDSVLISSAQLAAPPRWASSDFASHVGSCSVVFVGLGDVASYAELRISQLVTDVGDPTHLHVVSPTIKSAWNSTAWAKLVPSLLDENKVQETANVFLDRLARAWVQLMAMDLIAHAQGSGLPNLVDATTRLINSLGASDAATIIRWLRASALEWPSGVTVVHNDSAHRVLLAAAVESGGDFEPVEAERPVRGTVGARKLEALICRGEWAPQVRRAAEHRAAISRGAGHYAPDEVIVFICDGHFGGLPANVDVGDIVDDSAAQDILDGPQSGRLQLTAANDILGAVA
jgi:hypothetical protein